jgi:hypothetical protein
VRLNFTSLVLDRVMIRPHALLARTFNFFPLIGIAWILHAATRHRSCALTNRNRKLDAGGACPAIASSGFDRGVKFGVTARSPGFANLSPEILSF